jgi:dihydroorotate dehydrogenase
MLSPATAPELEVEAFGHRFAHPLGLAAGFDKDALGHEALLSSGFAFVEVGTVTAHAQSGNPAPRLFRLTDDEALINRMGFNNRGSAAAAMRLANNPRKSPGVLGINIGKSKVTPEAEAAADYALSATRLAPFADYMVVNVSSPNTPGLRDLQSVEKLEPILLAVRSAADKAAKRSMPLLVKIAPDLANEDVDAVGQLATHLKLSGIIATNTTISRDGLRTSDARLQEIGGGGLSGAPLRERSLEVLRRLRQGLPPEVVIVSVGGLSDAEDAFQRLEAGASLLQLYTSYIYGGPLLPKRLVEGLLKRVRQ